MLPLSRFCYRAAAVCLLAIAALAGRAEQVRAQEPIAIQDLGKGSVALSGPWRFHTGDNPEWASPGLDDSGWEQLAGNRPWGEQGHARYTGYAWYRRRLALSPAAGVKPDFAVLLQQVDDAYEVYWNGALIGRNGRVSPFPIWYDGQPIKIFSLGNATRGVLAIRVWKAPLLSDDSGQYGGFEAAPEVGSPAALAAVESALDYQWLKSRQFLFGQSLVYVLVALLSFLAWWWNRRRMLLFWMTMFVLVPPAQLLLLNSHLALSYPLAMGAAQPLDSLQDVSFWFLLLWLLLLDENRRLHRLTRILAAVNLFNGIVDGVLVAISWNPRWIGAVKAGDAVSAVVATLLEVFPLVLAGFAFPRRKRLDGTRWLVAIFAFIDGMIVVLRDILKQGRQFTGWSISSKIDAPLFTIGGSAVSLLALVGTLLLVALVCAVYKSFREDQRRHDVLEWEKEELLRAREQMRHHAEHDDLTGLWNHRIIIQRLGEEVERSRRDGAPLSVIMADIDHFKNINDSYGHPAGDVVLKEVSAIFMRSVRAYDLVGRYGGEEFLVILPGAELESACLRAEELRMAIESAPIFDGETRLRVTSSFGVASGVANDHGAEALIHIADEALYRAKADGRNCIVATDVNVLAEKS